MSTWNLVSKQHQEALKKIQLLEEASIDLLAKKTTHEKSKEPIEDFLKFFKVGLIRHFEIEETALFPILKIAVKDAEPLIFKLISEHENIVNKYLKLKNTKKPQITQTNLTLNLTLILTDLLKTLSAHARKEEKFLPPLVALLNMEQLRKIDELTRRLGYSL